MNIEFIYIYIALIFSFFLSVIIISLSYFLVFQQNDAEKISAYECGFQPFEEARGSFDIKFYLVAILFIVFDLEIMFLFPWAVGLSLLDFYGFWSMIVFIFILSIGFLYEWKKGALDW